MAELDEAIHQQVLAHAARGDALADTGDFRAAIGAYDEAWRLIPEPKTEWNASTWLLGAIGDAAWLGGFGQTARDALDFVMHCPGAVGNPFLHLRRGQVLFDSGEHEAAAEELMRAYMGGGPELFEDQPAEYLDFLRHRADIP